MTNTEHNPALADRIRRRFGFRCPHCRGTVCVQRESSRNGSERYTLECPYCEWSEHVEVIGDRVRSYEPEPVDTSPDPDVFQQGRRPRLRSKQQQEAT